MAKKKAQDEQLPKGFSKYRDGIRYRFYLEDGTRTAVYGNSIDECIEKRQQKIDAIKAENAKLKELGLKPNKKHWTVKQYADEWLNVKRGVVKEASLRQYNYTIKRIVDWKWDNTGKKFGNLYLEKVEPSDVRKLQREIADKMTTETANYSVMILSGIYKMAIEERLLVWNPCKPVKPLKRIEDTVYDTKHRALSVSELKAFFDNAKDSHYYNLFVVLARTGMRISEAGALFIGDIVADGINVKRSLTKDEVGRVIIGKDCKTADGCRFIPIDAETKKALERQKARNRMLYGDKIVSISTPIFLAPQGGYLHDENVIAEITRICELAKIERFTCHAFRSTAITRWVEDTDMTLKETMEISGHRDVKTAVKIYQHTNRERKIRAMQAVNWW